MCHNVTGCGCEASATGAPLRAKDVIELKALLPASSSAMSCYCTLTPHKLPDLLLPLRALSTRSSWPTA